MRYSATIKYERGHAAIKVTSKLLEGDFTLPDFLKAVREAKGHTIKQTHLMTDFPTEDCEKYENGTLRIPQEYLKSFCIAYGLPVKLSILGYNPEKDTKNRLAENLKRLRMERDIPQIIAAAELGVARSTYACYETGKNEPDVYTLIKIADYYKVSLDYLVGRYQEN